MKRVLIFSTAYLPMVGGAELAIKEITDRISDIEFDLICGRFNRMWPPRERIGNVTVYRIGVGVPLLDKLLLPFAGAILALRLDKTGHYICFWTMMAAFGSGGAFIANILRFWRPVPIVLTLQEGDSEARLRYRWGGLIALSWWLALKRATMVTVISQYLGKRVRSYGYRGTIEIIPNGVDTRHFSGESIPHSTFTLITTSRLVHKNAVDDVIRALAHISGVHFKILGIGTDEPMLKKLAKDLNVATRVEFVGLVDNKDVPSHLHRADIFIRPSRSEGMGNSFIEAMAAGLPVIATQEGGIKDFLFDAKRNPDREPTGWAVDKNSPEQIAEAVKDILANPEQTKKVIENARQLVTEKYDWDLIARDMQEKVFDRVLKK